MKVLTRLEADFYCSGDQYFIVMEEIRYAVFLRGVNVGGHAPINMEILKGILSPNHFTDVQSYINSGNLILSSSNNKDQVRLKITELIKTHFGQLVGMVIKTRTELNSILEYNPFDPQQETENKQKVVFFLSDTIDETDLSPITKKYNIEERYYHKDDVIWIYFHNGSGKTNFTTGFIEKKLKILATARNWNTVLKIFSMMQ